MKCKNTTGGQIDDLCLYNYHLRNELKNSIVDNLSNNNYFDDLKKANTDGSYEIQLLSNYGKTLNVYNSINWIEAPKMIPGLVTNIQTACNSSCDSCRTQLSQSKSKSISMFFAGLSNQFFYIKKELDNFYLICQQIAYSLLS